MGAVWDFLAHRGGDRPGRRIEPGPKLCQTSACKPVDRPAATPAVRAIGGTRAKGASVSLEPAPQARPRKILIADDNPQILELLEAYLEPIGAAVLTAADGEQALKAIEREQPDIVLLDVMMPKRSGFEVCRIVKESRRGPQIPIILITALNEVGDVERGRECGADDFLSKPVNKLELLERVQAMLAAHDAAQPHQT